MFGSSGFGSFGGFGGTSTPSTTGFGTPGAFGAQSQTPATPAGGLFGSTQTSTAGSSLFGTQSTTFGQPTPQTGFNFGASAAPATGGMFGQPQTTQTTSLFSTPASNTAFGGKTPGFGGFGSTAATSTGGGGGLFGSATAQPGTSSLFSQTSSTVFGANAPSGTTVKFNPPTGQDTMVKNGVSSNINTRHQCITAMKEYETKCLEELRDEDYTANRKGKQQQSGGMFNTQTTTPAQQTGFGFGQNKATGFGAAAPSFGSAVSTSAPSLFGQAQPAASTSIFGQTNKTGFGTSTSTGFGFGATPSTSSSLFGANQAKPPFGSTAPTTTQSTLFGTGTNSFSLGFGTNTSTGGLFGAKTGGFGTPATTSTGFGFGATQSGGLFGAKTTTASSFGFGTNTSTTGFGGVSGFGTSGVSGFGANTTGGLFGNKAVGFGTATTGLNTGTFGFGAAPAVNAGGLFGGNNQAKPTFGFNTAQTTPLGATLGAQTGTGGFNLGGNTTTLGTNTATGASAFEQAQLQQQLQAIQNSPYGDSPLFWNLKQSSAKREDVLKPTNPAAQKAVLASTVQYKVSPHSSTKIKPKSLHSLMNGGKSQLFDGLEDDDFSFGNDTFLPRKSVKKLVLRGGNSGSGHSQRSVSHTEHILETPIIGSSNNNVQRRLITETPELPDRSERLIDNEPLTENIIRSKNISDPISPDTINRDHDNLDDTIAALNPRTRLLTTDSMQDDSSAKDDSEHHDEEQAPAVAHPPHPSGIVITRPGYYTVPSLDELTTLVDENNDCFVDDLTIGREGFGSVFFPGVTNVSGLNVDEIVHFRRKEVVVYPDDETKPPLGEGLNKKAEITLDCVWPNDKTTRTPIKSPQRLTTMNYRDKIEEITLKIGAKFIDYRPETGSWVFEVKHFSKYGLVDDSDEEDLTEEQKKLLKTAQQKQLAVQKQKVKFEDQKSGQQVNVPEGQRPSDGQPPVQSVSGEDVAMVVQAAEPMTDDDAELPGITTEQFPGHFYQDEREMESMQVQEPSSHRLAVSLGVSARNMQVMKASFFTEEDETDAEMVSRAVKFQRRTLGGAVSPVPRQMNLSPVEDSLFKPKASIFSSPMKIHSSRSSDLKNIENRGSLFAPRPVIPESVRPSVVPPPVVPEHILLSSGIGPMEQPRKIVGSRVQREIPAVRESLVYEKQHMLVDAGCFMGRSFRVGWGPNWTLAHSGQVVKDNLEEKMSTNTFSLLPEMQQPSRSKVGSSSWTVTVEKLNAADYFTPRDKLLKNVHESLLEIQLDHSESIIEDGCPQFVPAMGVKALHLYAEQTERDREDIGDHPDAASLHHMGMVWDLCVALWGNLPEYRDHKDIDRESYSFHQARRDAFSRWLTKTAGDKIQHERKEAKYKGKGHLASIMSCLTGHDISEACNLAQQSGDHRLALLLAQAAGNFIPRQMISRQLSEWGDHGANEYIDDLRLKIYSLLSGCLVWPASTPVNTCEGLDWKRALAFHLWYHCRPNALISEAVNSYDEAFKGKTPYGKYVCQPLPPYLEDADDIYTDSTDDPHVIRDTCYHLLKLYSQKSHRLERVLAPTTSTPNQLDFRLSWHLSQILQALHYRHLSDYDRTAIHMNFSSHLESLGLWHWAVFITLHIEDASSRESAVRELLSRHIELSTKESYLSKEHFLQEKLLVPSQWIHDAKAVKAHDENRPHDEAWHLLKARHWNKAHIVIQRHISADAIINENHDYLKTYLTELAPHERCSAVLDWHIDGGVFLDYITLCETLHTLRQGEPSAYELEKLQPQVTSLCSRIGSLHCYNAKDRLCQSEMAKKTANLLRTLLLLQSPNQEHPPTRLLAPHISNLPMPEDYSLQELRALMRSFMLEMTS